MPDRAIRTAPTVEILHQLHGEGRGTFALFHYVWAQLHCTSARFHKRVRILDGDEEVWGRLFEPPDCSVEPSGELIQAPPNAKWRPGVDSSFETSLVSMTLRSTSSADAFENLTFR